MFSFTTHTESSQALRTSLEKRWIGKTHCDVSVCENAALSSEVVDQYIAALGFSKQPEEPLIEITRADALVLLTVLCHWCGLFGSEIMTAEDAAAIAQAFVDRFSKDAKFFTNGETLEPMTVDKCIGQWAWNPITENVFDCGLVAFDKGTIGMVWFEETD